MPLDPNFRKAIVLWRIIHAIEFSAIVFVLMLAVVFLTWAFNLAYVPQTATQLPEIEITPWAQ